MTHAGAGVLFAGIAGRELAGARTAMLPTVAAGAAELAQAAMLD